MSDKLSNIHIPIRTALYFITLILSLSYVLKARILVDQGLFFAYLLDGRHIHSLIASDKLKKPECLFRESQHKF